MYETETERGKGRSSLKFQQCTHFSFIQIPFDKYALSQRTTLKHLYLQQQRISQQSISSQEHNKCWEKQHAVLYTCVHEQHVLQAPVQPCLPPPHFFGGKIQVHSLPKKVNMTCAIKTSASLQYNKRKLTLQGCPGNLIASQHCTQEPK